MAGVRTSAPVKKGDQATTAEDDITRSTEPLSSGDTLTGCESPGDGARHASSQRLCSDDTPPRNQQQSYKGTFVGRRTFLVPQVRRSTLLSSWYHSTWRYQCLPTTESEEHSPGGDGWMMGGLPRSTRIYLLPSVRFRGIKSGEFVPLQAARLQRPRVHHPHAQSGQIRRAQSTAQAIQGPSCRCPHHQTQKVFGPHGEFWPRISGRRMLANLHDHAQSPAREVT